MLVEQSPNDPPLQLLAQFLFQEQSLGEKLAGVSTDFSTGWC